MVTIVNKPHVQDAVVVVVVVVVVIDSCAQTETVDMQLRTAKSEDRTSKTTIKNASRATGSRRANCCSINSDC